MWGKGKRRADFYLNADLVLLPPFFSKTECVRSRPSFCTLLKGVGPPPPQQLLKSAYFFASLCLLSLRRRTSFPRKEIKKEEGGK